MGTSAEHGDVNILLTSFAGLGLPRTLSLPTTASTTIRDALDLISVRLPGRHHNFAITTTSSKALDPTSTAPISTLLLKDNASSILPLRLFVPILGGKGGFGSQLRAAGGRMSSRKKNRDNNINPNGSNRNLDGRRLRTVDEAKKLAEYLAIKPEMEKREKEERRKRWEAVVEASEKREEEIKRGGVGGGRLDSEWVEAKEGAEERVRESVMKAMKALQAEEEEKGVMEGVERTGSESEVDGEEGESGDEAEDGSSGSSEDAKVGKEEGGRKFFGWDDEDEDDESEEEEVSEPTAATPAYEGKGKAKA